jgi:hypothetical protein
VKAGQSMRSLTPEEMGAVLVHPDQQSLLPRLAELIRRLRSCLSDEDYYEFQRLVGGELYKVEERRAQCSHVVKRLKLKKTVPAGYPEPAQGLDPGRIQSWEFEALVHERLARQIRTVGDALAWRRFGYGRRIIFALSRNQSPGPFYGKDGLQYELGRVEACWRDAHHFALLHDLTNCLRIADITEFTNDHGALLHEVKAGDRVDKKQMKRIEATLNALLGNGPFPGEPAAGRIVEVTEPYRNDLPRLNEAIELAKEKGCGVIGLPHGRAIVTVAPFRMNELWKDDLASGQRALADARAEALELAGIGPTTHRLTGNSGDTAARSPVMAPFAIYPLSPGDAAALTCDFLTFETIVSVDGLIACLKQAGLTATVLFPDTPGAPSVNEVLLWAHSGDRGLTAPFQALWALTFELLRPDTWSRGVRELVQIGEPPEQGVIVFEDEESAWSDI